MHYHTHSSNVIRVSHLVSVVGGARHRSPTTVEQGVNVIPPSQHCDHTHTTHTTMHIDACVSISMLGVLHPPLHIVRAIPPLHTLRHQGRLHVACSASEQQQRCAIMPR